MTDSTALSESVFFAFATGIISAAVSVVTIRSPKGAVFAFSLFSLGLGGLFYALGITSLAILMGAVGVAALVIYRWKFARTGERADDRVNMLASPNQIVAVFVLLCFLVSVTPVWIYSVWSSQAGNVPRNIDVALLTKFDGQYFPILVGWLLALSTIALFAFQLRRWQASSQSRNSAQSCNSVQNRNSVTEREYRR